ncbi:MAG TPA: DUF1553 domain-containing protein, partial [Planctomycetaceae bacterium]|nr:DUF1553 domain-containing protein [Planctomycetaceae bacterium]
DPENPLTARVLVNRLWLHHFGQGIVRSPNNFGFLADPPTHPELLDWLASEFLSGGMTVKRMHKLILTSKTWQQSSIHPEFEAYQTRDSGNRLWWRAERRRLDAESLRDAMLAVSGDLDLRVGGPSFKPTISPEALEGLSRKTAAWQASPHEEQLRRSVYVHSKRGLLPPLMTTFDLSDATQSCGQRDVTTVPTQALALLNNRFVHERSEALAKHLSERATDRETQIELLWKSVYGRRPSSREMDLAVGHLREQQPRLEEYVRAQSQRLEQETTNFKETLPGSLILKLSADAGVKTDSDQRVLVWRDQSGHSHDARQSKLEQTPRLSRFEDTKIPVLDFDGNSRFLHLDGQLLKDQPCTFVAVVSDRGKPGHREIISNWNAPGNIGTALFFGLTAENTVRFSDHFADAGQVTEREKLFVLIAVNGRDRSAVYQNGRPLAVRDVPLPERNLSTPWVIGQQGNINGEFWNGAMAEIRVYSQGLSDPERRFVERELSRKYQIPLATDEVERVSDPGVLT